MKILLLAIGIIFSSNFFAQEIGKGPLVPQYVVQLDIEGETYLLNGNPGSISCTFYFANGPSTTVSPSVNSGNYDYIFISDVSGLSWTSYSVNGYVGAFAGGYVIHESNSASGYTEYLSTPWILRWGQ